MKKIALTAIAVLFIITTLNAQQGRGANLAIDSLKNEKDLTILQTKLNQLAKGGESDLMLLSGYYRAVGNAAKADSVGQVIIKKYPKGTMAFVQFQNTLFTTRGGKAMEAFLNSQKHNFVDRNLDNAYHSVAYGYAGDKDLIKMKEYHARIRDKNFQLRAILTSGNIIANYDLKAAEEIMSATAETVLKKGASEELTSDANGKPRAEYEHFMDLYANILIKNGKYEKAFFYAKAAYDVAKNKSDQQKSNYAFLLSKTGKHQDALLILKEVVGSGKGNEALKLALKESYHKLNPGKDAAAYLAHLEQGMKRKIEEEIAKVVVNEVAPNFVVTDVNGKTVSLADFAGKTIVLDFWATWCGPCTKSFPAMQMVVNRYKNDPNVKLLFIHTWERVSDPLTDARTYLSNNNFKLDLYMDTKDGKTKTNPAVSAFGVKGIPAKFVIDGKGKIRFRIAGFAGGDDAAVAELSAMIDFCKKG